MEVFILGSSVISSMSNKKNKPLKTDFLKEPVIPEYNEVFKEPLTRYGRFDMFTKIGCSACALSLKDADRFAPDTKWPAGLIISSKYESYSTDLEYYKTTIESGGIFTSPNLFSYTLPGIVLGECSAYFKLTGPTFTVGENTGKGLGYTALQASLLMLESGETHTVITGWLDYPPALAGETSLKGAVFFILTADADSTGIKGSFNSDNELTSIFDLFSYIK